MGFSIAGKTSLRSLGTIKIRHGPGLTFAPLAPIDHKTNYFPSLLKALYLKLNRL